MSGKGIHLMLKIPKEWIPKESEYLFNQISVIKTNKGDIEFIFNNHFCTLTKNQIPIRKKDNSSELDKKIIQDFLMNLVQMDKRKQEIRENRIRENLTFNNKEIENKLNDEAYDTLFNHAEQKLDEFTDKKSLSDYSDDDSRYETACATYVLNNLLEKKKLWDSENFKKKNDSNLGKTLAKTEKSDIIYIVYKTLTKKLPHREKHDEMRNDIPWLLYVVKQANDYLETDNHIKKEKKAKKKKK